jgi:4-amino-4-deoxychorismate lyase
VVAVLGTGVIDPDSPAVRVDDLGLTRGDGCFEATRVVTGAGGTHRIDHLGAHLDRFARSAAGLELPPLDRPAWQALIAEALAAWTEPGEAMLRLMLSRGRESQPDGPVTGLLTLVPTAAETLRQRRDGIDVITLPRGLDSAAFEAAPWLLGGVKTLSYAVNVAGLREARRRGADDVIFTSSDGYLLEAPTATAVWLAGGVLHTTPLGATGVLASITQQGLFEAARTAGFATRNTLARVADLQACEGAWLVSSGRGVARLRSVDGLELGCPAGLTERLTALAGF